MSRKYNKWAALAAEETEETESSFLRKARDLAPKDGTPSMIRFDHGEGVRRPVLHYI